VPALASTCPVVTARAPRLTRPNELRAARGEDPTSWYSGGMGTWGPGPFDNDAAADFVDQLQAGPARAVSKALRAIARMPAGAYIDVDAGGAAWAACEIVALAFGHGDSAAVDDPVLDSATKLAPKEDQRRLALEVASRIADPATSELAALWHEGADGLQFDASLAHLRTRLEVAVDGPREPSKARTGDVICIPAAAGSTDLVVVQVVGPGEIAVFEGPQRDDTAALEAAKARPAHRVPASVNKLLRRGRALGNLPLRKDLKGKKLYAGETGAIADYVLATANGGGLRVVSYEEARNCDVLRPCDEHAIRAVACGTNPIQRVRSPEERETELATRNATRWAARREATTHGPFGDVESLERLVQWMKDHGVENAVRRFHDEAVGAMGYGRPAEDPERRSFAFAAIVALWRNAWSPDVWPAALKGRLPAAPNEQLMDQALSAARTLADQVITRDSELRMIWERGADRGAGLHAAVASLQSALSR
jgi:hypothetical protein